MTRIIMPKSDEAIEDDTAQMLRQKTPAQRIQMTAEANDTARILAAGGIRSFHPDWSDDRVQHEVARRMLDAAD